MTHGISVHRNPPTKPNGKNPDYKIGDDYYDSIAPRPDTNARNVWDRVRDKVVDGQAEGIVLNLSDSNVSLDTLHKQFSDYKIPGLKRVLAVGQDGKVYQIY